MTEEDAKLARLTRARGRMARMGPKQGGRNISRRSMYAGQSPCKLILVIARARHWQVGFE